MCLGDCKSFRHFLFQTAYKRYLFRFTFVERKGYIDEM